jgi:hypothetical protein
MAVNITPLANDTPFWNNLVYADSGAGKTVLAGSDKRVLFIAPEDDGTMSALRMGSKADKIKVREYPDFVEAVNYLYDHPEILAKYDVLSIDSLTELQPMIMRYILKVQKAERLSKGQDPDKPQIQDYGTLHNMFDKMIRSLNDLPVNVLYTALARKVEDADHNEFLVPEISGKDYGIAMKTVALMTCYGYLRTEIHDVPAPTEENPNNTKPVKRRVIYWEDTGTIRGKDRTMTLAPYTVNATLQHIRLAIDGVAVRNAEGRIVKKRPEEAPHIEPAPVVIEKGVESDESATVEPDVVEAPAPQQDSEQETQSDDSVIDLVEPVQA